MNNSEFVLTQGAGQKLEFAVNRNGGTGADLEWLSTGENFKSVALVARGHAEIKMVEHLIDCDATPFCPAGWTILPDAEQIPGRFHGKLRWDREKQKTALFLSKKQTKGSIEGNELRKELEKKAILPANVLDYLLAHPHLIPEEWKGKAVFFWGTIYRNSGGNLFVRYLYWVGSRWRWRYFWLGNYWDSGSPAAVSA